MQKKMWNNKMTGAKYSMLPSTANATCSSNNSSSGTGNLVRSQPWQVNQPLPRCSHKPQSQTQQPSQPVIITAQQQQQHASNSDEDEISAGRPSPPPLVVNAVTTRVIGNDDDDYFRPLKMLKMFPSTQNNSNSTTLKKDIHGKIDIARQPKQQQLAPEQLSRDAKDGSSSRDHDSAKQGITSFTIQSILSHEPKLKTMKSLDSSKRQQPTSYYEYLQHYHQQLASRDLSVMGMASTASLSSWTTLPPSSSVSSSGRSSVSDPGQSHLQSQSDQHHPGMTKIVRPLDSSKRQQPRSDDEYLQHYHQQPPLQDLSVMDMASTASLSSSTPLPPFSSFGTYGSSSFSDWVSPDPLTQHYAAHPNHQMYSTHVPYQPGMSHAQSQSEHNNTHNENEDHDQGRPLDTPSQTTSEIMGSEDNVKERRRRLTEFQRSELEKLFFCQKYVSRMEKREIANRLGLLVDQVTMWFSMRRYKLRRNMGED